MQAKDSNKIKKCKQKPIFCVLTSILLDIIFSVLAFYVAKTLVYFDPFLFGLWSAFSPFASIALITSTVFSITFFAIFNGYAKKQKISSFILAFLCIFVSLNVFKLVVVLITTQSYNYMESHIILYVIFLFLFAFAYRLLFKKFASVNFEKDLDVQELLQRKQFEIDKELMQSAVYDKVVCVTGGAGSIGSELCRQALEQGCKHLVVFDYHENGMFALNQELSKKYDKSRYTIVIGTVREKEKLEQVFSTFSIDIIYHAAAYKHVPMMEFAVVEAIKTNLFGTKNVYEVAQKHNVKTFVLVSTDKAVNPSSVMGATKRLTEMLLQVEGKKSKMKTCAVRFGNVLFSSGSVVPIFIEQIKQGGPITLTDRNMKRYFMSIPESVSLLLQTGALANSGEVFVLDMGEPVYIYDLAVSLIKQSGNRLNKDIKIEITGLRSGEKLFEQLRYDEEKVDKTKHKGVFVNKLEDINEDEFYKHLDDLKTLIDTQDEKATEQKIFSIVPNEYRK